MGYKVKLNVFEGPFDLLVYLIESAKMNIYDIEVSKITSQYLSYLNEMEEMDVAVSSEFMTLAAELIELKSKLLLPKINKQGEEILDDDPRNDLVTRILEYKKFKNISEIFAKREDEGFKIYEKPKEDISQYTDDPDESLILDINKFISAFNIFLSKKKKVEEIKHRYEKTKRQKITAEARMDFIRDLFENDYKKELSFTELIPDKEDKYDIALSFSSLLEMIKQHKLTAEQKGLFNEILVKATINMEGNINVK